MFATFRLSSPYWATMDNLNVATVSLLYVISPYAVWLELLGVILLCIYFLNCNKIPNIPYCLLCNLLKKILKLKWIKKKKMNCQVNNYCYIFIYETYHVLFTLQILIYQYLICTHVLISVVKLFRKPPSVSLLTNYVIFLGKYTLVY